MNVDVKIIQTALICLAVTACGEDPPAGNPPPKMPIGGPNMTSTAPAPTLPPPAPVQSVSPNAMVPPPPPKQVKLTADECKSAQKKLESLKEEDMTTKDSKLVYFVVKGAKCDVRPPDVTEAQRTCLSFPQYASPGFATCVTP